MRHRMAVIAGIFVLFLVWAGPLPLLARGSFAAHMFMHMGVVAVAAPLLAYGLLPLFTRWRWATMLFAFPIAASLLDLVVIWGWHTPLAHEAARTSSLTRTVEQFSFLAVGLFLWLTALAGSSGPSRFLAGAAALLFTSMHMTMLGVLIGLMQNPICAVPPARPPFGLTIIVDQQLGGLLMLGLGGLIYLAAGLVLVGKALQEPATKQENA